MTSGISLDDLKKSACAHLNSHLFEETVKKRSKYKNMKVEIDGNVFDSKKEARRYVYLRQLQQTGEIKDLQHHQIFNLSVCKYEADFTYYHAINGKWQFVVEDVKSKATAKLPVFRMKKKLMLEELKIEIKEV